jgi:ABC-2 type transport system permease protein
MRAAIATEALKLYSSTIARATTLIVVLGIALICASMLLAAGTADAQMAAKLGPIVDPGGWVGYFAGAAQVTSAAGLLGCGVLVSWMFGREFGEGTITGLFAIPVRRDTIAAAKLIVYGLWAIAVSVSLVLALLFFGLILGLGTVTTDAVPAIGRQIALSLLTATIALPSAWAATVGRSVIAGIGAAIGILVVSQVTVVAGAGGWFTFSAPALWAVSGGSRVSPTQLALVLPLVIGICSLILVAWRRLQLDR